MSATEHSLDLPQTLTLWVRGAVCDDGPGRTSGFAVDRAEALPAHLKDLLAPPEKDEENGYWIVEGFGAAADNVQTYPYGKVFRPAEEVFAPESIEGWRGLPVIVHHPRRRGERKPLLDIENSDKHQRGSVIDVQPLPGHNLVKVRLKLTSKEAIDAIDKQGMVELSLGYRRDLCPEPGVAPDGTAYQWTCRNILPNHLAIVDHARAGSTARVATDSSSSSGASNMYWIIRALASGRHAVCDSAGTQVADFASDAEAVAHVATLKAQNTPSPQFRTIALDGGRSLRVHPDDAQALMDLANMPALQQQRALADTAKAEAEAANARAQQAETDAATHKAAAEAANAELTALKTKEDARALKVLRGDAKRLLGDDGAAVDSMDQEAIQKAVIGSVAAYKGISLDGRTPEALGVLYESAVKLIEADRAHLGGGSGGSGDDDTSSSGAANDARSSSGPDPKALRKRWMQRQQNFGQAPAAT